MLAKMKKAAPVRKSARTQSTDTVDSSEKTMEDLIKSFAQIQADSNRQLVESLLASRFNPDPASASSPSGLTAPAGSFARCTARFRGEQNDPELLEAFLDAVQTYKECANVSDAHALKGLPILLEGEAAVWWRGVKAAITTWSDAVARLRAMFGVPRPPFTIFRRLLRSDQGPERAQVFIARIRAEIALLPYDVIEEMQLDIIYGSLNKNIRERVTRESVSTVDQLIEKARAVEESLAEVDSSVSCAGASAERAHAAGTQAARAPCALFGAPSGVDTRLSGGSAKQSHATSMDPSVSNAGLRANRPEVIHPLRTEESRNYVGCAAADILRADEDWEEVVQGAPIRHGLQYAGNVSSLNGQTYALAEEVACSGPLIEAR
ncbi:hypothetical protein NE865_04611 [Phthorimaea operculella]|nr:hypothetical protein NE865_04611 [Phthorimaea operculella]